MNSKYQSRNSNGYKKRSFHQERNHPYHSQDHRQQQHSTSFDSTNEMDSAILISNLKANVTKSDFQDLFYDVGRIVHVDVHMDQCKRMVGTAVVVFQRRSEAVQASMEFDGYMLGEHPMKIKLMNSRFPRKETRRVARPQHTFSHNRKPSNKYEKPKRTKSPSKTLEELDAELDEYNKKRNETK